MKEIYNPVYRHTPPPPPPQKNELYYTVPHPSVFIYRTLVDVFVIIFLKAIATAAVDFILLFLKAIS